MSDDLTHTDEEGATSMVDVGEKPSRNRRAVAQGTLRLQPGTVEAIKANSIEKGDVGAAIRLAAVQGVKHTWESIPLCHQIPITNVETTIEYRERALVLRVAVDTNAPTGCEMEALQGVTTGLTTAWDMVKAAEKDPEETYPETAIESVQVLEKTKGPVE